MEADLAVAQATCEELSSQRKSAEKSSKENSRLKTIISSQDERVRRGVRGGRQQP